RESPWQPGADGNGGSLMRPILVRGFAPALSALALIAGVTMSGATPPAHADPNWPVMSSDITEFADGTTYLLDTALAGCPPLPGNVCPGTYNGTRPSFNWDVWGPTGGPIPAGHCRGAVRPDGASAAITALKTGSCPDIVGASRG